MCRFQQLDLTFPFVADVVCGLQFHPTGFFQGAQAQGQTFLISEAVRGEGGLLYNLDGKRFMSSYDDRLELAPRDVVARSIHDQVCVQLATRCLMERILPLLHRSCAR